MRFFIVFVVLFFVVSCNNGGGGDNGDKTDTDTYVDIDSTEGTTGDEDNTTVDEDSVLDTDTLVDIDNTSVCDGITCDNHGDCEVQEDSTPLCVCDEGYDVVDDIRCFKNYTWTEHCYQMGDVANPIIWWNKNKEKQYLREYYGKSKLILLVFSQYHCPPCEQEAETLPDFYRTYKDKGLEIIEIFIGDLYSGSVKEPDTFIAHDDDYVDIMSDIYGQDALNFPRGYLYSHELGELTPYIKDRNNFGTPANYIIDGKTFEIVDVLLGWDKDSIESIFNLYLR